MRVCGSRQCENNIIMTSFVSCAFVFNLQLLQSEISNIYRSAGSHLCFCWSSVQSLLTCLRESKRDDDEPTGCVVDALHEVQTVMLLSWFSTLEVLTYRDKRIRRMFQSTMSETGSSSEQSSDQWQPKEKC